MRFAAPYALVAFIVLGWWLLRSAPARVAAVEPRRSWRAVSLILLILAAAGLEIQGGTRPRSVMFVLDRSDSMNGYPSVSQQLATLQAGMRAGDHAGLVVFGADATVEHALRPSPISVARVESRVNTAETDLEAALRRARISLPRVADTRVVLLSDGAQTSGNALHEADRFAFDRIPIDVVIPTSVASAARTLEFRQIAAPSLAPLGEPFVVSATIAGPPRAVARVALSDLGSSAREQTITVPASGFAGVAFSVRPGAPGLHTYEMTVRLPGTDVGFDDSATVGTVVAVTETPRILYVSDGSRVLHRALAREGFRLEYTTPEFVARSSAVLATYDAVVLDGAGDDRFDSAQQIALRDYVEQHGGGLLILGGPDSLGVATVPEQGLDALLPVDLRPRGGERGPEMALVIAFDKSGSMADRIEGVPRIEFARQAVSRVLHVVPGSDALGVIAFDATAHTVVPLRPFQDLRAVRAELDRVAPEGATALAPPLELAARWLDEVAHGGRRHVLLITDGQTSASDAARASALVRNAGFELSVVAVGAASDRAFLQGLAARTGGRAYFPHDIQELPTIVARESARISGGHLFEGRFQPQALAHPVLTGIDTRGLPSLDGYVVGALKPSAVSILASPLNDPILASRRVGLGKTAMYTADLAGAWSSALRAWPGSERLFRQMVRWLARQVHEEGFHLRFVEDRDVLRIILDAQTLSGEYLSGLKCEATVRTPAGEIRRITLSATVPGRYEATTDHLLRGTHVVELTATGAGGTIDTRMVRGFYWNASAEGRGRGVDSDTLQQIANATGGRVLAKAESAFANNRERDFIPLWPWLAGAALFLYVAEIRLPPLAIWAYLRRRQRPSAAGERTAA
jgi:Mg-chelatase subunit ChlD